MIALRKEDEILLSKEDMKEQLAGLMGGRVAEEIIFNVQTTGLQMTLDKPHRWRVQWSLVAHEVKTWPSCTER